MYNQTVQCSTSNVAHQVLKACLKAIKERYSIKAIECRLDNVPQYYAQTAVQSLSVQAFVKDSHKQRIKLTIRKHTE